MAHDKSREIRFGLVMYGGVALAIYINGVTHEFSRLMRGNRVYKFIKALTDTEMIVDIVSGTSAGGINGIFLAYALANNLDFGFMAQLWRKMGDLQKLLRPINTSPDDCKSLLDSEGYYEPQLKKALEDMPPYRGPGDEPADFGEFDLFVTGTDVDGRIYTTFDDGGHSIDVKDHRTVFWLKHRPHRKLPFEPSDETRTALARLARITSCFPAAFRPVPVGDGAASDDDLMAWGMLDRKTYFLDGGLLDNKPFTHTIQAIFERQTDTPSERVLCYVEPDPERFQQKPDDQVLEPTFLTATFEGAQGIPTYQSIADDLKMINMHNSQVERYWHVCADLVNRLPNAPRGVVLPDNYPDPQKTVHNRSRLAAMARRALGGLVKSPDGKPVLLTKPERDRVHTLVDGLINLHPIAANPAAGPAAPAPAANPDDVLDDPDSLTRFDVYFRVRRLHHMIYKISTAVSDANATAQTRARLQELWRQINIHLQGLEILRYWMEWIMDHVQVDWRQGTVRRIWGDLRWYLESLLVVDGRGGVLAIPQDDTQLETFYNALRDRAEFYHAHAQQTRPFLPQFNGILTQADLAEDALFARPELQTWKDEFEQYIALDAVVYPMIFVSKLEGKDPIQLLRMSPLDAKDGFCSRPVQDKLAGETFAHFGGFFKQSWRSNDILWGRLDAICELARCTVTKDRLTKLLAQQVLADKVAQRFQSGAYRTQTLFPHASNASAQTLDGWVQRLLDPAQRNAAIEQTDQMVRLLITLEQTEVLYEVLPTVIADAAEEQAAWNQYKVPAKDLGVYTDVEVLAKARKLSVPAVWNAPAELQLCTSLADLTRQDPSRIDALWRRLQPAQDRRTWWDQAAPNLACTNGQLTVQQAVAASYRALAERRPEGWRFQPAQGFVQPQLATVAADQYARAIVNQWSREAPTDDPNDSAIARFFTQQYRVGSEDVVHDMPVLVLTQLFSSAGLVLKNCILGAIPRQARKRIEGNTIFYALVNLPLQLAHWFSQLFRNAPVTQAVVQSVLFIGSLLTLTLAIAGRNTLLYSNGQLLLRWVFFLIVLPLSILIVQIKISRGLGRLAGLVTFVVVLAGLTLLAFWFPTVVRALSAGIDSFMAVMKS